jgi:hypothetical protein
MRIINITEEEISKMRILKEDNVFLKGNYVYKKDTESEEIIKKIIELGNHPALDQLSKPQAILEMQKEYYGYVMKYYKALKNVNDAIKQGIITNLGDYFNELFMIVTKLNLINLIYWDFHEGNILCDKNGKPFIIDLDDISDETSDENLIEQKEYLLEFLLGTFLGQYRGYPVYFRNSALKDILNKEANEYLEGIYNRDMSIKDMPYSVLTELEDNDKTNALKLSFK